MIPVHELGATLPVLPFGPDMQERRTPARGRDQHRHGDEAEELHQVYR